MYLGIAEHFEHIKKCGKFGPVPTKLCTVTTYPRKVHFSGWKGYKSIHFAKIKLQCCNFPVECFTPTVMTCNKLGSAGPHHNAPLTVTPH